MKKSLLALAVIGAFAGAAQAQTNVTIYGVADMGYKVNNDTGAGTTAIKSSGISDGAIAGNRIGFRGTEDLGGGLKANFVTEQGIAPTNDESFGTRTASAGHQIDGLTGAAGGGYSNGTNRQSWLGLSGNFGEVRIGYQYTNMYDVASLSGYTLGSEGVRGGDFAHLHGFTVVGGTRANGITYITPSFSGLTATLQYGAASAGRETAEVNGVINNGTRMGLRLNYKVGAFSADFAHTQTKQTANTLAANTTSAYGVITAATQNANTGERSANLNQLAASYDFGVLKLAGTFNSGKDGGTSATSVNSDYRAYQVGVRIPVGAFALIGSYGQARTSPTTGANSYDDKGYQLAAQYSLSKRTTAYVYHGKSKDTGTAAAATALVEKQSTIIGMIHTF